MAFLVCLVQCRMGLSSLASFTRHPINPGEIGGKIFTVTNGDKKTKFKKGSGIGECDSRKSALRK